MDLKYMTLKSSIRNIIDKTTTGYRVGVWDGFYEHDYNKETSKGIDSVVYNYLYNKGYNFGYFLKQTNDEWEEADNNGGWL